MVKNPNASCRGGTDHGQESQREVPRLEQSWSRIATHVALAGPLAVRRFIHERPSDSGRARATLNRRSLPNRLSRMMRSFCHSSRMWGLLPALFGAIACGTPSDPPTYHGAPVAAPDETPSAVFQPLAGGKVLAGVAFSAESVVAGGTIHVRAVPVDPTQRVEYAINEIPSGEVDDLPKVRRRRAAPAECLRAWSLPCRCWRAPRLLPSLPFLARKWTAVARRSSGSASATFGRCPERPTSGPLAMGRRFEQNPSTSSTISSVPWARRTW
jgi:hypothetical protein